MLTTRPPKPLSYFGGQHDRKETCFIGMLIHYTLRRPNCFLINVISVQHEFLILLSYYILELHYTCIVLVTLLAP
jgi:hypothetical protein